MKLAREETKIQLATCNFQPVQARNLNYVLLNFNIQARDFAPDHALNSTSVHTFLWIKSKLFNISTNNFYSEIWMIEYLQKLYIHSVINDVYSLYS